MKHGLTRWIGILVLMLTVVACRKPDTDVSTSDAQPKGNPANTLELLFTYGSEKEEWVKAVTADFNRSEFKAASGKSIHVTAVAKGSGELVDGLINGTDKAQIASPASSAFIKLGNAQWRAKHGKDLFSHTDNLLLSPVVIAMWQPMAEAMGWGKTPVGWADILKLAKDPQGWQSLGYPQWGRFKFGHTHPQFSNSGLISLFAELYAATGKKTGLTAEDIARPETARFLGDIEGSVVHYGSSTGFFGKKMFANGPQYMSAAVLYENMVIEAYGQKTAPQFPIVAIYPKEGTFWSDHPAGIVDAEWVTDEQREGASKYLSFLLERPQQERALKFGFRPALAEIPLGAPIDTDHGVNPREPQTTLDVPDAEIMDSVIRLWRENKKHSNITLVIDVSGSMNDGGKIQSARLGAQELIRLLDEKDTFRLMPFNNQTLPSQPAGLVRNVRDRALRDAGSLIADGGTALYDTIATAYREQMENAKKSSDKITAVVVLTDGADTDSKLKLDQLLSTIRFDNENRAIRVFTIGYGVDAETSVLKKIAEATQAKFYEGKPENIREVFKDISTFF